MKLALLLPLASALAPGLTRRAALDWSRGAASAAALALAPAPSRALEFPTFGEEARIPLDLGPIGLKKEGASGKLNSCPAGARPCISSSDKEAASVVPWFLNNIVMDTSVSILSGRPINTRGSKNVGCIFCS